jgi:hypothetical protein
LCKPQDAQGLRRVQAAGAGEGQPLGHLRHAVAGGHNGSDELVPEREAGLDLHAPVVDVQVRAAHAGGLHANHGVVPLEQLRLRYRLAAAATDAYFRAGFTVVLEDVVAGDELAGVVELVTSQPLYVVVLLPGIEAIRARDDRRDDTAYAQWPLEELYAGFAEHTPRLGSWLDTSNQEPEETVDEILGLMHGPE